MARPRNPVGVFGEISSERFGGGRFRARVRYRDTSGRGRQIEAHGASAAEAKRRLRQKIADAKSVVQSSTEISGDTAFPDLVAYWLDGIGAEGGELATSTRERYAWEAQHLLLPAFQHFTVREVTVGRVERWLTQQRAFSYARAVHSKKILSLVMGVAVRLEAIDHNPVTGTKRIKRPPRTPTHSDDPLGAHQICPRRGSSRTWASSLGGRSMTIALAQRRALAHEIGTSADW